MADVKEKPEPPKTGDEYQRAAERLAFSFAPRIYACKRCQWPVASGYCCMSCGSRCPSCPNGEDE